MVPLMVDAATLARAVCSLPVFSPRRLGLARRMARGSAGLAALMLLGVVGCGGEPLPPSAFGGPTLEPERFFEGRTVSFGLFENGGGAPTGRFSTEAVGRREGDALVLDQTIRLGDGSVQERQWRLRRVDAHRYEATAAPVVGTATGEAHGRVFRWRYTLSLPPGDWLRRVEFDHWMYLAEDGKTLLNRFAVRKLGFVVARASEVFQRAP
jgi:hypothetical protein